MSEKKPRKGKGQFKVKTPKTNPPQNNEDKIEQLMTEAERYCNEQNYEEAIKCYTKIIELDPENKTTYHKIAYNNRGVLYNILRKYKDAKQDLDKAIKLDKKYTDAYNNRGVSYNNLGRYEDAIIDLNKAIKLNPNFAEAYNNRGISYIKLGNLNNNNLKEYKKALKDFDKAIALDKTYKAAYFNKGNLNNNNLKEYKKAIFNYTQAIAIDPNYYKAILTEVFLIVI